VRRPKGALDRVAARLAAILGDEAVLIGGLAVGAHGHVRATDDVDFASSRAPAEVQALLSHAGLRSSLKRGDVREGDPPWVVRGEMDGIAFDVLPPLVPIAWESAIEVSLGRGARVRVVDLWSLLQLKLRAGGPQDLLDVAMLLRLHPDLEGEALRAAEPYGLAERLRTWLADPRLRSSPSGTRGTGRRPAARGRRRSPTRRA
jgi:hypothetical protein